MYKALFTAESLAKSAAHQHVACIGDKGYKCYFGIAGVLTDEGNGGEFTGRSVVEQACQKALEYRKPGCAANNSQRKGYGKIPQSYGDTIVQALAEGRSIA